MFKPLFPKMNYQNKVGNHKQLGGIETSILDNGAGAGVRIAWIDTGSGLRYKVVIDRGMDIAEAIYNDCNLAWIAHVGIVKPQLLTDKGLSWLRTFGGGLLTTCGLDHVGGPETDEYGERGIHGQFSNLPAEIISIQQPNVLTGDLSFSITGLIRQHKIFGPCLTLKRTISGTIGNPSLKIDDEIVNEGNQAVPFMILYHFNFGYPLLDQGSQIIYEGEHYVKSDPKFLENPKDLTTVPNPSDLHAGTGESVVVVDMSNNKNSKANASLWNPKRMLGINLSWDKKELPYLINWQHFAKKEYVMGIEPSNNPLNGQKKAREEGTLTFLQPNEIKKIQLELKIIKNI
ncbi:MAG: hypothetical protein RI995_85 [Bacteroidota bacterium]|jgi:galactose mutarotase-like enzyme